jgi:hypothetical protein
MYKDARQGSIVDLVLGEQFRRLSTPAELARGRQGLLAPAASAKKPATKPAIKPATTRATVPAPAKAASPSPSPSC